MLLRTINMQISRTNQVRMQRQQMSRNLQTSNITPPHIHHDQRQHISLTHSTTTTNTQLAGKIQQIRRLPATLQTIHSLMPTGAHNRFNLLGRNQIPFGDHYNLLYAAERSQGRPFAGATGGAGAQRQHAIFGERGAGHGGADPLSLHMVHNSAAAVASMHMTPQANTAFSRHVAAGLGMKPVMYGPTGNQSAVNVPSALRATTAAQQQQQGVGMSPSTETKPTKDSKRRGKRGRQQQQQRPPANTMQTPKKIKKSNDGEEDEEDETPVGWVQCNRCKEWRQLPRHIDAESLPDQWFCKVKRYRYFWGPYLQLYLHPRFRACLPPHPRSPLIVPNRTQRGKPT